MLRDIESDLSFCGTGGTDDSDFLAVKPNPDALALGGHLQRLADIVRTVAVGADRIL